MSDVMAFGMTLQLGGIFVILMVISLRLKAINATLEKIAEQQRAVRGGARP